MSSMQVWTKLQRGEISETTKLGCTTPELVSMLAQQNLLSAKYILIAYLIMTENTAPNAYIYITYHCKFYSSYQ
jgi:hypothetical protein